MRVAVIGTGIIGVCAAAWLQRDGHQVVFVDPRDAGEACSFGNAGSMSPSACLPVGMPGVWKKAPRWLLDPLGPLNVRWSYLPFVLPWLARFLHHSSREEVARIAAAMRSLLAPIFEAYAPLLERARATALVRRTGCLYVYSSREMARQWQWGMDLRRSLGVEMRDVHEDELLSLEPDLRGKFRFGILAPENGSTLDPSELVKTIHGQCLKDGAAHIKKSVQTFLRHGSRVTELILNDGTAFACDGVVVAAGAWSRRLAAKLGSRVPLETQRGYHVTVTSSNLSLRHTVMAVEHNLMVNPMKMGLRLAGSVEFGGLQAPPNYARAKVLLRNGMQMFPHLDASACTQWMGHRPCLPDSMPVIGRAPAMENAWLAFGHGHVGMCAGASTGREIAHLVAGRPNQVDLSPFRPNRF
jgi:D-amino-acid dehydrogenase